MNEQNEILQEVVYVSWYLHDRWSGNEESGSTIHLNQSDCEAFLKRYKDSLTDRDYENAYYIQRKPRIIKVTENLFGQLLKKDLGLMISAEEEEKYTKEKKMIFY